MATPMSFTLCESIPQIKEITMAVDSETLVALMDNNGHRWTEGKVAEAAHDIIRETSTDTRFLDAGQKLLGAEIGAGFLGSARAQAYSDDRNSDGFYRTRAETDRGFAHNNERVSDSERRLDNRIYESERNNREGLEATRALIHQSEIERMRHENMRATMENMELKTKLYVQEALERRDCGERRGFYDRDFRDRGFHEDRAHNYEPRININIVDDNLDEEEERRPHPHRRNHEN
jgi:hypothetical protein